MTEKQLEEAVARIIGRLDDVNKLYVAKVAAQIRKIGELTQSSVNRLVAMAEMNADVAEIKHQLQIATGLNAVEMTQIYKQIMRDTYTDKRFSVFLQENPMPRQSRERLNQMVNQISQQTAATMVNISNTTAIAQPYQEAVDRAVLAVSSGVTDYKSAVRDTVRQLGSAGLQVYYESGHHRRLDTAVRQNIIDATNQLAQRASLAMSDQLGFDAVEISAHARSAPDHEPVQGRVFLRQEFDKMQLGLDFDDVDGNHYQGFKRPIGEWNCMHMAMGFSTQYSVRRYTDEQLREWQAANSKGCEINGKHYSTYKAVQLMREIETEVRRQKDIAIAAEKSGDEKLRLRCQRKINALGLKYTAVAKAAKITPRRDRMAVEGFRAIKVN